MTITKRLRNLHNTLMTLDRSQSSPLPSSARRSAPSSAGAIGEFYFKHWSAILLVLELILDLYFLHHGPLHPIDYPTYLIQTRQIRLGERDYARIQGPTGPLVYPGGHVIIFRVFERLFGIKTDPDWPGYAPAQWIFLALQLGHTFV